MKELLELIAKALVDHPEEVSVSEVFGEQTTILELSVAQLGRTSVFVAFYCRIVVMVLDKAASCLGHSNKFPEELNSVHILLIEVARIEL